MKDGTLKQASKILSLFEDTPSDQVQAILASGLLADLRDGNVAAVSRDEFRRLLELLPLNPPLLEPIGTVGIAATGAFVARERFAIDASRKAKVKISYLGDNFEAWFLDKVEASAQGVMLRYARLIRSAPDEEIRREIGAEHEETTLAAIYALMERQPNGESGVLLTDGRANIFYVRGATGTLRAVYARWDGDGWLMSACSVSGPIGWDDGFRVFSRNS